jgi:hypothetical protein
MKSYTLNTVFTFGKFNGKTLKDVLETQPGYLEWCAINLNHFYLGEGVVNEIEALFPSFKLSKVAEDALQKKKGQMANVDPRELEEIRRRCEMAHLTPNEEDDCWIYKREWAICKRTGKRNAVIMYNGRKCHARGVAYILKYGPVPEDVPISRTCSTPFCINPKHLKAQKPNPKLLQEVREANKRVRPPQDSSTREPERRRARNFNYDEGEKLPDVFARDELDGEPELQELWDEQYEQGNYE